MKIEFQPAFAVDILHDYYPDGISQDFSVVPTPHCQRILQKYGLLFKPSPAGFGVLYETAGGAKPKCPFEQPLNLSFVLRSKSAYLYNYSELPLDKSFQQAFVLSNRQKNLSNGQRLLSADPAGEFLSALDLLDLRQQRFQVATESSADSVLWELFDNQQALLQRQRVATVEGVATYLVDLSQRQPGRYLLRRDGIEYLHFYADEQLTGRSPFGLIEIAIDPSVTDAFRFVDADGSVLFRRYQLKLPVRKTTWEYFVVANYETELKATDLTVSLDDPPVTFNRQPAVTLADGRTAVPFVADRLLPLTKQPVVGITLKKKKGPSTARLQIDNLPNPAVNEIIPAAGDKVISRVYVYV